MNRKQVIKNILIAIKEEYPALPVSNLLTMEDRLNKMSDDELRRVKEAIEKFGAHDLCE